MIVDDVGGYAHAFTDAIERVLMGPLDSRGGGGGYQVVYLLV